MIVAGYLGQPYIEKVFLNKGTRGAHAYSDCYAKMISVTKRKTFRSIKAYLNIDCMAGFKDDFR
jgi:hypothetical protein